MPSQRKQMVNVTLDAGPAVHQSAGLSRYTERLIRHLADNEEVGLSLFYNGHSGHGLPHSLTQLPARTRPMGQLAWRLGVLLSQLLRQPLYQHDILQSPPRQSPTLYHATEHLLPFLTCPTILTVHDLIFHRYPAHHTLRNQLYLRLAMPLYVRRATQIIAVSHHTKQDLIELYGTDPEKISVIYEGVDEAFQPASEAEVQRVRNQYSPDRPYLLMVGTLEPRKNHITAIRAMAHIREVGLPHRLVIAGGKGWLFDPIQAQISQLGLENEVSFAGFVPEADLSALYSGADCVLVPSLYEGFGFSVVEAMACGAPVICSQVSSLGEIGGTDVLPLQNPEDEQALAALVEKILKEPGLAQALSSRGRERAAQFRWAKTAEETARLYKSMQGD